ncbi:dynamin family protein [Streptomyces poonensis]|uniref:Dynamin N-terminal domain-containing protein n=1 Tax=Streptomyces poonensis TaxID=68255 RepID=A0A918PCD8_9ACTN|nr:dynamin family protein [Streptomyces poonensis]GGY99341.1 hypothetical protein GCM10010365_17530 [Streptomyces poonensis]
MPHEEIEQRILDVFSAATALALELRSAAAVDQLDKAERALRDRSFTLVVMGEFSRGKSSLLNAYLKEPGIFPVHSYIATRLVTTARHAPTESVVVSLAERPGRPAEERRITRAEIPSYACETSLADGTASADADRATTLSVALPNERLAQGLVVVDTPGIGGVHRGHTAAAVGVLSSADVVLYVTDAQLPLYAAETAFIEDVARALDARACPERLVFAVTKADRVADPAAAAEQVRDRLRAVPGLDVERTAVVPVSARHRLLHLAEGDPERETLSGFSELERCLEAAVTGSRARLKFGAALARLDQVARDLLAPVEEALAVLEADDETERSRLREAAEQRRTEAARQVEARATWVEALHTDLGHLSEELQRQAAADLAAVWREVRASYRKDGELLEDPQMLLDQLARRLAMLIADLGERARTGTAEAGAQLAERTGVDWRAPAVTAVPLPPLPEPDALRTSVGVDAAGILAQALSAALEGARMGAAVGGKLGEIAWSQKLNRTLPPGREVVTTGGQRLPDVGPVAGGPTAAGRSLAVLIGERIGAAVGATVAFAGRLGLDRRQQTADRITALDQLLAPWEQEQLAFLTETVRDVLAVCGKRAADDLTALLDRRRSACERAAVDIESALHTVGDESSDRRRELIERRTALHALRASVTEAAEAVAALTR